MKKIDFGQTISILANLGVIAGILFLVLELSQNNTLLGLQAASAIEDRRYALVDVVLNNPEYLDLLRKDRGELTEAERQRLTLLGISLIMTWEALHEAVLRGNADEEYARRVIRDVYWRPVLNYGADLAWQTYKGRASPGFVSWMEENVLQAGPAE